VNSNGCTSSLGCALGIAAALACGAPQGTERVFDGRTVTGPYIEPSTYAAYADGAYLEARGEWKGAEEAYRRALEDDPESPAIWTRLGVILCRSDFAHALEAFRMATEQSGYAPAWAARARCLHGHQASAEALESAKTAITLDPTSADANLLIAEIYREQARPASSRAWLFAWLLLDPEALSHWKTLDRQAKLLADPALALLLRSELERQARTGSELGAAALETHSPAALPGVHAELEAAIARGDLSSARLAASSTELSELDLAQLALQLGQLSIATSQAELILKADPENTDAWVIALCAAALGADEEAVRALLQRMTSSQLPTTDLAKRFTELLGWWIDDAAAADWAEVYRDRAHRKP